MSNIAFFYFHVYMVTFAFLYVNYGQSNTDRTDQLFEPMKLTEEQRKPVMFQVRNDESQYWAIRQILKDLYPFDGDHEVKAVGFGDGLATDGKAAAPAPVPVQAEAAPAPLVPEKPKVPRTMPLRITSVPPGAELRYGDDILGVAPVTMPIPRSVGGHPVEATLAGHRISRAFCRVTEVDLAKGEARCVVELRRARKPRPKARPAPSPRRKAPKKSKIHMID